MLSNPMVRNFPQLPLPCADGSVHYLRPISVPLFDENHQPEYTPPTERAPCRR